MTTKTYKLTITPPSPTPPTYFPAPKVFTFDVRLQDNYVTAFYDGTTLLNINLGQTNPFEIYVNQPKYQSPDKFFTNTQRNYPNFLIISPIYNGGVPEFTPPLYIGGFVLNTNKSAPSVVFFNANTDQILLDVTYLFEEQENPCFSEGTGILVLTSQLKEEYKLVQDLIIGDFVKSYIHGYRKVSKMLKGSFVNNPKEEGVSNCMYIMSKTEDNGLIEDLTLTRNHGVLVEKLTEDEEKKVDKNNLPIIDGLLSIITADSDKFEKVMDNNMYNYYHFSLETDGDNDRRFGVYANGLLVETPSNNMMDNALNVKPLDF